MGTLLTSTSRRDKHIPFRLTSPRRGPPPLATARSNRSRVVTFGAEGPRCPVPISNGRALSLTSRTAMVTREDADLVTVEGPPNAIASRILMTRCATSVLALPQPALLGNARVRLAQIGPQRMRKSYAPGFAPCRPVAGVLLESETRMSLPVTHQTKITAPAASALKATEQTVARQTLQWANIPPAGLLTCVRHRCLALRAPHQRSRRHHSCHSLRGQMVLSSPSSLCQHRPRSRSITSPTRREVWLEADGLHRRTSQVLTRRLRRRSVICSAGVRLRSQVCRRSGTACRVARNDQSRAR